MNTVRRLTATLCALSVGIVLLSCAGTDSKPSSSDATVTASEPSASATESYTPPNTEGPSNRVSTAHSTAGHGPTIYGVNGPSLGNDSGVWNNWGYLNQATEAGVTAVGHVSVSQNVEVFLYSQEVHSALVTDVTVSPSGGPFWVLNQHCSGQTLDGIPPHTGTGDTPAAVRRCVLTVEFAPQRPAPAHPDSPYQGYYHGLLNFTLQAQCSARTAPICTQIPSGVLVDGAHVRIVTWQTSDDLWGATACPVGNPGGTVNGCDVSTSSSPGDSPAPSPASTPSPEPS